MTAKEQHGSMALGLIGVGPPHGTDAAALCQVIETRALQRGGHSLKRSALMIIFWARLV